MPLSARTSSQAFRLGVSTPDNQGTYSPSACVSETTLSFRTKFLSTAALVLARAAAIRKKKAAPGKAL